MLLQLDEEKSLPTGPEGASVGEAKEKDDVAMYVRHLNAAKTKQAHAEREAEKMQAALAHVTVSTTAWLLVLSETVLQPVMLSCAEHHAPHGR